MVVTACIYIFLVLSVSRICSSATKYKKIQIRQEDFIVEDSSSAINHMTLCSAFAAQKEREAFTLDGNVCKAGYVADATPASGPGTIDDVFLAEREHSQ